MPLFYRSPSIAPGTRVPALPVRSSTLVLGASIGAVAIVGVAAVWAGLAAIVASQCAWMAPVAALDAALLLRLASFPAGSRRAALALAITAATIVVGNALVATALIGRSMGMRPVHALTRMSPDLAWLYVQANSGWVELAWYALAGVLAWRVGR
jgi:hypothetical protein